MTVGALVLALALQADDVGKHRKTLADASYGNYWDRKDAAEELRKINTWKAAEVLLEFAADADETLQDVIVIELGKMAAAEARDGVVKALPTLRSDVARANVIKAMRLKSWDGKDAIARHLKDPSPRVRVEAVRALDAAGDPRAAEGVGDSDPDVIEAAIFAAVRQKVAVAAKRAGELVKSSRPRVAAAALLLAPEAIGDALKHSAYEVRLGAVLASPNVLETCGVTLHDKDWRVRAASVEAVEGAWEKGSIDLLLDRLAKEEGRLVLDIVQALERLTGKQIGYKAADWKTWWTGARESFAMPAKPKPGAAASKDDDSTKAKFYGVPLLSKRLVFIIDCSGSMKEDDELYKGKRRIDVALEELEKAIGALEPDAKFNVIMLSTEATAQKLRSLSPKLVPAGEGNRKKAIELVKNAWAKLENIKRGRGDIYDAVMEAMADGEADTVLLLTDGAPTDGRYIDDGTFMEALTAEHRYRRVAVHAILTGAESARGTNEDLMKAIAAVTRGLYRPRQ